MAPVKLISESSGIKISTFCIPDKAERLIAQAAGCGSQLVVFPEAFIGGYPCGSNIGVTPGSRSAKGKKEFRKYHTATIDVPEMPM